MMYGMTTRTSDRRVATAEPETWHDIEEAAAVAKRSVNAMRQLRIKGRGPRFRKVDGRLMVSDSDLQCWLRGES